ncbi:WD40-repeat-containing domain protein [Pavlovales sp. CCMP2436]|nr:WD40-repeat-containing domain protein [Pavlovales sp. CCMP2436]
MAAAAAAAAAALAASGAPGCALAAAPTAAAHCRSATASQPLPLPQFQPHPQPQPPQGAAVSWAGGTDASYWKGHAPCHESLAASSAAQGPGAPVFLAPPVVLQVLRLSGGLVPASLQVWPLGAQQLSLLQPLPLSQQQHQHQQPLLPLPLPLPQPQPQQQQPYYHQQQLPQQQLPQQQQLYYQQPQPQHAPPLPPSVAPNGSTAHSYAPTGNPVSQAVPPPGHAHASQARSYALLATASAHARQPVRLAAPPPPAVASARQATFRAHARGARVNVMALSGAALYTASDDCTVCCFELSGLQCVSTLRGHTAPVLALCVHVPKEGANETHVVAGAANGSIRVWEVAVTRPSGAITALGPHHGGGGGGGGGGTRHFRCVHVLRGTGLLVSGDAAGTLELWSLSSGERLRALGAHRGALTGELLLSLGADQQLRWWDTKDGLFSALGHASAPMAFGAAICQSAEGVQLLLTGGEDGCLYEWHLLSLTPRARLVGHTQAVCAVASADGGLTGVTAAVDGTIRLWDVQTGECLATLEHEGASSMVTSALSNRIFVGSADGCVTVIEPLAEGRG